MSSPVDAFEQAHEGHTQGHEGPVWVPVAAAVLAVLAAFCGYLSNLRSTSALIAKNDSIVATARASDTYAQYQAERIKYYVSQSAIDAGVRPGGNLATLRANVDREAKKGPPLLEKAKGFEDRAERLNLRSERLIAQHETIEIATTLFEVSIVLISIAALVGSRLLPIAAGTASALGVIFAIYGLVR